MKVSRNIQIIKKRSPAGLDKNELVWLCVPDFGIATEPGYRCGWYLAL